MTIVPLLLCLQFSVFTIARSTNGDGGNYCTPMILLLSEVIKGSISAVLCRHRFADEVFRRPAPLVVPATCFVIMNIVSFWCTSRVPAAVYVIMMQLKLPFTLVMVRVFLCKKISMRQLTSIVIISLCCLNIVVESKEGRWTMPEPTVLAGLVLEPFLSSMSGIFMQTMLQESNIWVRNFELATISVPMYAFLIVHRECFLYPNPLAMFYILLASSGGILAALMLKGGGALSKNVVTSASLVVVAIIEHVIHNTVPQLSNISFCIICSMAVFTYATSDVFDSKLELSIESSYETETTNRRPLLEMEKDSHMSSREAHLVTMT